MDVLMQLGFQMFNSFTNFLASTQLGSVLDGFLGLPLVFWASVIVIGMALE